MSLNGKRLLLLGGSNSTEDILRFAEENDITLIATAPPRYGLTPLKKIAAEAYDVGAVVFSNVYGQLGLTDKAKEILEQWK